MGEQSKSRVNLEPLFVRIPRSIKGELERLYPVLGYKDLSEFVRDILRKYIDNLRIARPELFRQETIVYEEESL